MFDSLRTMQPLSIFPFFLSLHLAFYHYVLLLSQKPLLYESLSFVLSFCFSYLHPSPTHSFTRSVVHSLIRSFCPSSSSFRLSHRAAPEPNFVCLHKLLEAFPDSKHTIRHAYYHCYCHVTLPRDRGKVPEFEGILFGARAKQRKNTRDSKAHRGGLGNQSRMSSPAAKEGTLKFTQGESCWQCLTTHLDICMKRIPKSFM